MIGHRLVRNTFLIDSVVTLSPLSADQQFMYTASPLEKVKYVSKPEMYSSMRTTIYQVME
jgi:hypothetical protein